MVTIQSVLTIVFQWFGFLEHRRFSLHLIGMSREEFLYWIAIFISCFLDKGPSCSSMSSTRLMQPPILRSDWKPGSCHSYRGQRRPPCEYENIRQRPNGQRVSCVIKMHAGELFPVEWSVTDIMMNTLNIFNNVWLHLCYGDHRRGVML